MDSFYLINPDPRDQDELLSMLCDLYSCRPETQDLEPWELQMLLWFLNHTDESLPEDEIAAAIEVARTHFDPDEGAA
jgi:hypothetical protein